MEERLGSCQKFQKGELTRIFQFSARPRLADCKSAVSQQAKMPPPLRNTDFQSAVNRRSLPALVTSQLVKSRFSAHGIHLSQGAARCLTKNTFTAGRHRLD